MHLPHFYYAIFIFAYCEYIVYYNNCKEDNYLGGYYND